VDAQNAHIWTASVVIGIEPKSTQIGGSARGYQPGLRVVGLLETADVRVADPYIHAPALAGQLSASNSLCASVLDVETSS
jgi:hypothetical protein